MLHEVGGKIIGNDIKLSSLQRYDCILIQGVNINEKGAEGQKQITGTGLIKVSGLIHEREKQSDARITWFVFHKIYHMHSEMKNK